MTSHPLIDKLEKLAKAAAAEPEEDFDLVRATFLFELRNNYKKLIKAIGVLEEAVEFYNDKEMFEQGHGLEFEKEASEALSDVKELLG